MLNKHKHVLVVYGTTHREAQMPVFEKMLGQGEMQVLAPERPQPQSTKKAPFAQSLPRKDG